MKYGTLYAYWTHEWTGDYMAFAKKIKRLGFDMMEISAASLLTMSDGEIDALRALCRSLDLSVSSNIGPPKEKDVASADPAVRQAGIEFLTEIMKKMDRLDSRALVGVMFSYWPCTFEDLDKPAIWARGVESVRKLGQTANSLGIEMSLEVVNRFETNILNTAEEGVRYLRDVDCDNVKLLLDTFHMNIEEDNIPDAIRTAGKALGHLHVGEGNRKVPGKGHLPWQAIGTALHEIGYDKGVVMEPFVLEGGKVGTDIKVWRDLSGHADEAMLDREIAASLIFLKKAFS